VETGKAVAIAGIAATAVVGVAGAAASWLIARDNRSQESVLAHEQRVYDRRADAYLLALRLVERQRRELNQDYNTLEALHEFIWDHARRDKSRVLTALAKFDRQREAMLNDADAPVRARLIAFGTKPVVAQYDRLRAIPNNLYLIVAQEELSVAPNPRLRQFTEPVNLPSDTDDLATEAAKSSVNFTAAEKRFQLLVQRELSWKVCGA
jgi:hypothetical protein